MRLEYPEVYMPQHHRAKVNGCVDKHILVAEQLIGRQLKDEEVVHHKDGDKRNCEENNLIVFASNSDHIRFHHTGFCVPTNEPYVFTTVAPEYRCSSCGKEIGKTKNGMCFKCFAKSRRIVERPSKEELEEMLKHQSYVSIGKMFGVSDNAIRKWLKN